MGICFDLHWGAHSFAVKGEIHVHPIIERERCVVVVSQGLFRSLLRNLATAATFLNRIPPIIVISAPLSIIP